MYEYDNDVDDLSKLISYFTPIQNGKIQTKKLINFTCLLITVFWLVSIEENLHSMLLIFTPGIDSTFLYTFVPLIHLTLGLILLWPKKVFGWVLIISFFSSKVFFAILSLWSSFKGGSLNISSMYFTAPESYWFYLVDLCGCHRNIVEEAYQKNL